MTALVTAQGNALLDFILGTAAAPTLTTPTKVRLTSTTPTAAAAGTELTGTGYTAGGVSLSGNAFAAAAAGSAAGPHTSMISWTNGSGGNWTIDGVEIWDSAGTPKRWLWARFNGAPITVANGNVFAIQIDGLTATLS